MSTITVPQVADEVDEITSRPTDRSLSAIEQLDGDLLILGAGGKLGPTLAVMAQRSIDQLGAKQQVIAASRFSNPQARAALEQWGVQTIAGDLFDRSFLSSLPDCRNVLFLAGMKFGTSGNAAATWAANVFLPGLVSERFRDSRQLCFSTGNIYGLVDHQTGRGSTETSPLDPVGEYANSCVGRERMFEYFSQQNDTPCVIIRLNYATEFRYGVLVDIATKVMQNEPVDLAMGYFNVIWQPDACAMTLASLVHASCPPCILNMTGTEILSVREVATRFGELLDRPVSFTGEEAPSALLNDSRKSHELLGTPPTTVDEMLAASAQWVSRGMPTWGKPTHFQVRDGKF